MQLLVFTYTLWCLLSEAVATNTSYPELPCERDRLFTLKKCHLNAEQCDKVNHLSSDCVASGADDSEHEQDVYVLIMRYPREEADDLLTNKITYGCTKSSCEGEKIGCRRGSTSHLCCAFCGKMWDAIDSYGNLTADEKHLYKTAIGNIIAKQPAPSPKPPDTSGLTSGMSLVHRGLQTMAEAFKSIGECLAKMVQ